MPDRPQTLATYITQTIETPSFGKSKFFCSKVLKNQTMQKRPKTSTTKVIGGKENQSQVINSVELDKEVLKGLQKDLAVLSTRQTGRTQQIDLKSDQTETINQNQINQLNWIYGKKTPTMQTTSLSAATTLAPTVLNATQQLAPPKSSKLPNFVQPHSSRCSNNNNQNAFPEEIQRRRSKQGRQARMGSNGQQIGSGGPLARKGSKQNLANGSNALSDVTGIVLNNIKQLNTENYNPGPHCSSRNLLKEKAEGNHVVNQHRKPANLGLKVVMSQLQQSGPNQQKPKSVCPPIPPQSITGASHHGSSVNQPSHHLSSRLDTYGSNGKQLLASKISARGPSPCNRIVGLRKQAASLERVPYSNNTNDLTQNNNNKVSTDTDASSYRMGAKGIFKKNFMPKEIGSAAKSAISTQPSTPEKSNSDEIHLATEIQKNLQERDQPQCSPLSKHDISWDYRTKMVDWMVEVCTSFKTSERAYFLAVGLFDNYLRLYPTKLSNNDVHIIGIGCMYLASKYEDIYPLHSRTVADKISHKAFSQKEVVAKEGDLLRLFGFDIDLITPIDFHQTYMKIVSAKVPGHEQIQKKISETAMLYTRMALQNQDFLSLTSSQIVVTSLTTACTLLGLDKRVAQSSEIQFYLSDFKQSVWQLQCETGNPFKAKDGKGGEQQMKEWANKFYEFSRVFDSWHPGLNQLKTFKKLSFHLSSPCQKNWRSALYDL